MVRSASVNINEAKMNAEQVLKPVTLRHGRVLFVVAFIVLITALAVPLGGMGLRVLDIAWIFSAFLGIAVLVIIISARDLSQLSGFAGLITFSILIRVGVGAASVRAFFDHGSNCRLVAYIGDAVYFTGWPYLTVIVPLSIIGCIVVIVSATRSISKKASEHTVNTIPFKYISTDADLNAGVISETQASEIKGKITSEARFYLSMSAVSKLMGFDAAIGALLCFTLVITAVMMSISSDSGREVALEGHTIPVVGISLMMFAPAVLVAWGSANLINNKKFSMMQMAEDGGERGTAAAGSFDMTVGGSSEEFELLNPDFAEVGKQAGSGFNVVEAGSLDMTTEDGDLTLSPEEDEPETQEVIEEEEVKSSEEEKVEEDTMEEIEESVELPEPEVEQIEKENEEVIEEKTEQAEADKVTDEYYDMIVGEIEKNISDGYVTTLLAAEDVNDMPVTLAVNIGFRVASAKHNCLLIDADAERGAIAKAFENNLDESEQAGDGPVKTCIDSLWIWSVSGKCESVGVDLAEKIGKVNEKFTNIIIYAPTVKDSDYYGRLAGMIKNGIFVVKDKEGYLAGLKDLLESVDCRSLATPE